MENKILVASWKNKLHGVPCFVIGNSPTLNRIDLSLVNDMFTIGINRAFLKIEPTILFWQDKELWDEEKNKIASIKSIRVSHPKGDPMRRFNHFSLDGSNFKKSKDPSVLHGRGSTGPMAVQFAYALGCRPIYLIGMDCKTDGLNTDFFGHNKTWKPHTLSLCKDGLDWINANFTSEEVINISEYPDMVRLVVEKSRTHSKGFEYYKNVLLKKTEGQDVVKNKSNA